MRSGLPTSSASRSRGRGRAADRTSALHAPRGRRDWTGSGRSADSITGRTSTSCKAASCRAPPCWRSSCWRSARTRGSVMPSGLRDADELLRRLEQDGIEHFWVAYHDYSGVACAKTMPVESFRSTVRDGVVFAMANLDMDILDVQPPTATYLADSGDFLAVPDPRSYAILPRFPKTARAHAWMRATDGSTWQGCPRTRLEAAMEELRREGYTVQVALEPEFYLLRREENGEFTPINQTRMFTMEGMQAEQPFVARVVDELRAMGVTVSQLGKEYG